MPQKEDKFKSLFADLGRPTLRGIRKCPKCGTVNGTRGSSCKNKSCDVVFRGTNEPRKKSASDACQLSNLPGCTEKIYSVRVRDRGPEHRSFVQITCTPTEKSDDNCEDLDSSTQQEIKCFVETCRIKEPPIVCSHIQAVQRCTAQSKPLHVKHSVISSLNIPSEHLQMLSHLANELPDLSVQRVSKSSFVVKTEQTTTSEEIGFVHVMFVKPAKSEPSTEKKSLCTCRPVKGKDSKDIPVTSANDPMCMHYYACICAFASNEELATEFEIYIPQATHQVSAPMLSQLHLVECSQSSESKTVELDGSSLSVEIMRDNISLLESIAAVDDSSLGNVQGLEGVLADQIIVTNVEDSLSFTDSTVLEGLEDADQQVCQIFSTGQNTIQLTTYTSQTQSADGVQTFEITSGPENITVEKSDQPPVKRKKDSTRNVTIAQNTFPQHTVIHNFQHHSQQADPLATNNKRATTVTFVTKPDSRQVSGGSENDKLLWGFEHWLAGVNDRINSTMNYQLPQNPDPLVYYIPNEFFECLKDRIASGGKKRRLPNQTLVFHRTDRTPLGTFTKHIWKITNILHIINVFSCSIVPLKTKQYFVKTNHGDFIEWVPPVDEDEKNQRIFPVLHSTYLKCGRNHESTTKESVPFVIEWVPEIFRDSRLGEMSLRFEFAKTGPIHEDDGHWGTTYTIVSAK